MSLRSRLRPKTDITLAPERADLDSAKVVRFFRNFKRFHGGHLKVHDYFTHVTGSATHVPVVTFTADSRFDDANPWSADSTRRVDAPEADVLFVAGRDWSRIDDSLLTGDTPVINLIQHLRHTDPSTDLYGFLERRAIRICVGPELGEAVQATGRARGPIVVIPNGIDVSDVARQAHPTRDVDLLIVATKQPEIGTRLEGRLGSSGRVEILTEQVPRATFLQRIGAARVAVFLPNPTEGFYLPALEAMALGTVVVCPDCVGNRSFCVPASTAFRPAYDEDAIAAAASEALAMSGEACASMTRTAMDVARTHDLSSERTRFLELLARLDDVWRS